MVAGRYVLTRRCGDLLVGGTAARAQCVGWDELPKGSLTTPVQPRRYLTAIFGSAVANELDLHACRDYGEASRFFSRPILERPVGGRFRAPIGLASPLTIHGLSPISRPLSPTADRGSGLLGSIPKECRFSSSQKDALLAPVVNAYYGHPPQ